MVELKGKKLLATAFLTLLVGGFLGYNSLPLAYCELENKTVHYIWLSESRKTATVVFSTGEDGFEIYDDRCQKGMEYGQWVPLKTIVKETKTTLAEIEELFTTINSEGHPLIMSYTDIGTFACDGFSLPVECLTLNLDPITLCAC